jgi:plasmid stabilization system protein ParE
MVKIVWTDSAIEDLNAIGESLVELPEQSQRRKRNCKQI